MKKSLLIALGCSLSLSVSSETLFYTENTNSSSQMALGYPVPIPVDSMTPVDGFRSYASLHAQHQALAMLHPEMQSHIVGQTSNGRNIFAYTFGDTDNQTFESLSEPAFLINGTIHAREWQSPEVVTELIEQLMEQKNDNGVVSYLLDNTNIIILPVLNIDGFLQTQRYPDSVTQTPGTTNASSANDKFAQPRDGRMRRKNMPNVDEDLSTENDRLLGVDLNRNGTHFFGVQQGNNDPNNLIYGGANAFSEVETQSLLQAAALAPVNKLRFYQDTHSFSRVLFVPQPNNSRRNTITNALATKFQNVTKSLNADYFPVIDNVGQGIASTADYFAYEYLIPTWTLEIEPPQGFPNEPSGGAFYGGTGASHSGFVTPDSAIARIRNQLAPAQLLMFYHQAGPANVKSVRIADSNNQVVYAADWQTNASGRTLNVTVDEVLNGGQQYNLWVSFSKPMRVRNSSGAIGQYNGQNVPLAPSISFSGQASGGNFNNLITVNSNSWLNQSGGALTGFDSYADDAFMVSFTLPANVNVSSASGNTLFNLNISVQDFAGLSLDANPSTIVDWSNGAWSFYENTSGIAGDAGGVDLNYSIKVSNSSLNLVQNSGGNSSGGGGSIPVALLLLLAVWGCIRNKRLMLSLNNIFKASYH